MCIPSIAGVDNPEYFQMSPEGVEQKNANTILPSSSTTTDQSIPFHNHNLSNNKESQYQSTNTNNNNNNNSSSNSCNNFLSNTNNIGSEVLAATGSENVFVNNANGSGGSCENLIASSNRSNNRNCVGSDGINVNANNTLKREEGIDNDEVLPPLPPRSNSQLSPSSPCGAIRFTYGNTGSSCHSNSRGNLRSGNSSDSQGLNHDSSNSLQWHHQHQPTRGHPSRREESLIKVRFYIYHTCFFAIGEI